MDIELHLVTFVPSIGSELSTSRSVCRFWIAAQGPKRARRHSPPLIRRAFKRVLPPVRRHDFDSRQGPMARTVDHRTKPDSPLRRS